MGLNSRANRKALTTWQDAAALKQLKHLANDLGVSQRALIAEGIVTPDTLVALGAELAAVEQTTGQSGAA